MAENFPEVGPLMSFSQTIIKEAGAKALPYFGKGSPGVRFDSELVTRTEIDLIRFFETRIHEQYPDHQVFHSHHETDVYSHEDNRYLWIFDPLDGSANFQSGIPIWGMSVALLENFWPVLGLFYMPSTGDMVYAQAGGDAYCNGNIIRPSNFTVINDESLLFTYSRFHRKYNSTFPGKIRDFGCTGAHFSYVAMGMGDAALSANESFQGLAALRIILEAAGGKIQTLDGSDFFLNEYLNGHSIENDLLACSPAVRHQIKECLKEN